MIPYLQFLRKPSKVSNTFLANIASKCTTCHKLGSITNKRWSIDKAHQYDEHVNIKKLLAVVD